MPRIHHRKPTGYTQKPDPCVQWGSWGEWRGGISPPRSLRTGREPLGSSGSRSPAVRIEKRPVRKELWVHLDDTGEPLTRAFRLLLEALVFAAHPFPQMEVDAVQTVVQRRLVEMTVVVDPTPDVRIYQPGQIMKGRVGPVLETPSPDYPTHCLESSVGRRGQERDAIGSVGPGRKPRLECISEEIELDCGIASLAVGIRAVNDFCFLRVKHQSTSREPLRESAAQGFSLGLSPAVADYVIRIPFKGNSRMGPCHPQVERVMQKQIR